MTFEDRLEKVLALAETLPRYKQDLMELAAKNLRFTFKDTAYEVDLTVDRLKLFEQTEIFLGKRRPLGGPGSTVAVMLSYNGSAWLNTVITSICMVGNKVLAKFASRGDELMALTRNMYEPIFGPDITFYQGSGKSFLRDSLDNPDISAVIVFGFDTNMLKEQGLTILLTDHLPNLVVPVSDRLLALDQGEIIAEGPPQALILDPQVEYAYLGTREAAREEG